MTEQLKLGDILKENGINLAEEHSQDWVDEARIVAIEYLKNHIFVTIDDIRDWAVRENKYPNSSHSWGSVFRGIKWTFLGMIKSRHASNHSRLVKMWSYYNGTDTAN